jgi:cytochrome c
MSKTIQVSLLALSCLTAGFAFAAERATKDEAVKMVGKAVAAIKADGADKTYKAVTDKSPAFTDRDLYVVVYGLDGSVLAHGANDKLVGKKMLDAKDPDGKLFVQERVELAQKQPSFWQDSKFVDPISKKAEAKQMYCERLGETVVCAGVYKL